MKRFIIKKEYLAAMAVFMLISRPLSAHISLLELYKTGPIIIKPDPSFGKSTNWESFYFDHRIDFTIAPDGSIFAVNLSENNIVKFDSTGKLVKEFGQKGQGPGDFIAPDNPSILDGSYLVVGEYATNRRITLFNLDGTFFRLLKTQHNVFSTTALKDKKIAYVSMLYNVSGPAAKQQTFIVMIKDAVSGTEIEVARWKTNLDQIQVGQISISSGERTSGGIIIAHSAHGNLLVGNTTSTQIIEYTSAGRKIGAFNLMMTPIPVTKKYIKDYQHRMFKNMKSQSAYRTNPHFKATVDKFESVSIDHIFDEYLPLYKEILVDSEGNILVFKKSECLENCPCIFQVYSPDGNFICETELVSEDFDLSIDRRFKRICFTNKGIFCLFPLKDDELQTPHLIKVDVTGAISDKPSIKQ